MNFKTLSPEEIVVRLAAVVDSSDDAIFCTDLQGSILTWNKAAETLFGFSAEEILGESILLLIPPLLHEEHERNMEILARGEKLEHYETQRLRKGGTRIDVSLSLSPVKGVADELIGAAVIARSMNLKREEEAAIARLAAIVESSDDAIVAKDLNGVVTDWNAAAERLFGFRADEMIGRSILTIIPPDLQHEEPMVLGKIRQGLRVEHYETQRLHKSGRRLEVALSISPIRDRAGRVIGASKIARDASERRRFADATLRLAAIVEGSDDAIVSKNLDGVITSWNAAAERLFGYKAEEIIGQSVLRIIPRELHYEEPGIIKRLKSGQRIEHFETRRVRKDGQIIDVSLTVSPIRNEKGDVVGGSKILRDIRDRRLAEAALVEKEKFAAAGRLAATLAHEVNNPLEAITNLAYLLNENTSLDAEARHYAELLLQEVQRAGDITRQTLGYYRESKTPGKVALIEVIDHVVGGKRRKSAQKQVEIAVEVATLPSIRGFSGELRQVFENLIDNAIDAAPDAGWVRVRGRSEELEGENWAVVDICDNGRGVDPDMMKKLFEPFFTTKAGKGSGLGLWVSRSIVHKHGGRIHVLTTSENESPVTIFRVELPLAADVPSEAPAFTSLSMQSARAS